MGITMTPSAVPQASIARTYIVTYNSNPFTKQVWVEVSVGGAVKGRALLDNTGSFKIALAASDANNIISGHPDRTALVGLTFYDAVTGGNVIAFIRRGFAFW